MVDVPFRPMNDHFVTILVFFAIFVGRRVPFFGHSLLSYSKRRHLSTSRVIPLIDCHQSLYHQHRILSTFLPDLCFIWQSHRFQFLGCALPIGFWQLLMNPKWDPHADVIFHQHRLANRCGIVWCHHMKGNERDGMRAATGWHERCSNVSFCYMKARNDQKKVSKIFGGKIAQNRPGKWHVIFEKRSICRSMLVDNFGNVGPGNKIDAAI